MVIYMHIRQKDGIMSKTKDIMKFVEKNKGVITTKQLTNLGIHRQFLSNLVKQGKLEKVERGVYVSVNTFEDTLFSLQSRFNKGIYSHSTALYLHGLTDRTPLKYTMTFPTSYNITNAQKHGIRTYRSNKRLYNIGLDAVQTNNGHLVNVYGVEKTLCDIVRGNSKVGKEEVVYAFKEYSKRKNKDLNALYRYARLLKVESKVRGYMEVLV
jgi:predicted transcriptional regulator of viral defense system